MGLGEIVLRVKMLVSHGKTERPCGALLQPVVAVWLRMQSVAGSLRSQSSGADGGAVVTPAIRYRIANSFSREQRQVGSSAGAAPP